MKTTKTSASTIEEKLKRLEEISDVLDRGTLPLEEQLTMYEEGVKLAKECREYIENAKLRVTTLEQNLPIQEDEA